VIQSRKLYEARRKPAARQTGAINQQTAISIWWSSVLKSQKVEQDNIPPVLVLDSHLVFGVARGIFTA